MSLANDELEEIWVAGATSAIPWLNQAALLDRSLLLRSTPHGG